MSTEPEVKRWTAKRKAELVKDIIKGNTTAKEATRIYDLTPAEVERWVDDALVGMENAYTVQRVVRLKGWQCHKRHLGFSPRIQVKASVADSPDKRWSTDIARVWYGEHDRWAALTLVMDCHAMESLAVL